MENQQTYPVHPPTQTPTSTLPQKEKKQPKVSITPPKELVGGFNPNLKNMLVKLGIISTLGLFGKIFKKSFEVSPPSWYIYLLSLEINHSLQDQKIHLQTYHRHPWTPQLTPQLTGSMELPLVYVLSSETTRRSPVTRLQSARSPWQGASPSLSLAISYLRAVATGRETKKKKTPTLRLRAVVFLFGPGVFFSKGRIGGFVGQGVCMVCVWAFLIRVTKKMN